MKTVTGPPGCQPQRRRAIDQAHKRMTTTHLPPPPRRVAMTNRCRALLVTVAVLPLFPYLFVTQGMTRTNAQLQSLVTNGVVVKGTIRDKFVGTTRGSGNAYYLVCGYTVGGRRQTANGSVSADEYQATKLGAGCVATYDPKDPSSARYGRVTSALTAGRRNSARETIVVFGGFSVLCLLVTFLGYRFERELLARGEIADGYVSSTTPAMKAAGLQVRYKYVVDGKAYEGMGTLPSTTLSATIPILYDPRRPSRNMALGSLQMAALNPNLG